MKDQYAQVKKNFFSGRIKGCRAYFESHGFFTEAGYCYLILDNFNKAEQCFRKAAETDTRANWGLFLLEMLKDKLTHYPKYFEVRNFLEIDLNMLILYSKGNYVEKILRYSDFMANSNPECYKFIGRVFWINNLMEPAMFFLRKAKDKFYKDPELHYLLGYIYYHNEHNTDKAVKSLTTCLEITSEYDPAQKLLAKITSK